HAKDKPHEVSKEEHVVTKKDVDFYFFDKEPSAKQTTYFVDGNEEIPYFELGDFLDMRNGLYSAAEADNVISISKKGNNVVLKRENGYPCKINFKKNTIDFIDYNMFTKNSFSNSLVDIVSVTGKDTEGNPAYLQRTGNEYSRYGKEIVLDLDDYDIDIIRAGKGYYVPLQTLLDLFMPSIPILYNGESLFFGNGFFTPDMEKTGPGEAFYSKGARKRSKELAEYSYNELCLALDFHYGLKESQHIDSFKELFYETGLDKKLKSTNGTTADRALYELVCVVLGGGHNGFSSPSSYAGSDARYADGIVLSQSQTSLIQYMTEYTQERMKAFPEGVPGYQEVGNTAYVTFDS
ncbi:MAG: hypothetical protein MR357_09085, partial [Anaeroplasma sp.]|nr:hypothetical protein [Anaeroplasma sp.]